MGAVSQCLQPWAYLWVSSTILFLVVTSTYQHMWLSSKRHSRNSGLQLWRQLPFLRPSQFKHSKTLMREGPKVGGGKSRQTIVEFLGLHGLQLLGIRGLEAKRIKAQVSWYMVCLDFPPPTLGPSLINVLECLN